jgi:hypothetical protein
VLFQRDLPEAAAAARRRQPGEVGAACTEALGAVDSCRMAAWRPQAEGYAGLRLGSRDIHEAAAAQRLDRDSVESLVKRAEDLRAHQARLAEVAGRIDARAPPAGVVDRVSRDHPSVAGCCRPTEALLEELRQFSVDAGLCTMPPRCGSNWPRRRGSAA